MSWGRSQVATATMAGDGGASLAGTMRDGSSGDGDKIRMERTGGAGGGDD